MNFNIFHFKSKPKNTPFAPEWNYVLAETMIEDVDFLSLTKFFKRKEKSILKLKPGSTGHTGLSSKSTTARHERYNIFEWKNKKLNKLKKHIINFHNSFLNKLNLNINSKIYAKGWVNIMRKNECIKKHIHDVDPDSYLGGHVCISCSGTSTYYINPINQINFPATYRSHNKVGKLTLFQNCIPHYTDTLKLDKERITIAFDLRLIKTPGFVQLI